MIAKRIELRTMQLSSFARLVTYITNSQGKNERVGTVTIANCHNDAPEWAAMEVEAVQARNKRTTMDKTYHLLVSFREGDYPTPEVLQAIEERICQTLGYGEHQRISAVHYDTDHMHIHIAINKIHPLRFTAHEPYFDKRKLGKLCEALEIEYGIAPDNHTPKMTQGEAKAQDMEKASGVESLIGWIKRGVLPRMLTTTSWEEMHALLGQHGLIMAERGNGLVVLDKSGIAAKASSINRALSKPALTKRLGPFLPGHLPDPPTLSRYEQKPVASKVDTAPLWALYRREQLEHKQRYPILSARAKERKERRIDAAKKSASLQRAAIKLTKGRAAQTILYHAVSQKFLEEVQIIRQDYKQDRQHIYEKGKRVTWYDWLKLKAGEGNADALEVLRRRYERQQQMGNTVTGKSFHPHASVGITDLTIDTITKRGTVHYKVAKTILRDDGNALRLAEGISQEVIKTALRIGMRRFGTALEITGSEQFRQQVVEVAAQAKLKVTFMDTGMEAQRKALIEGDTPSGPADDAVARYVNERNGKREKGIDIVTHRRYDAADAGTYHYAGVRYVEEKSLLLLQTPTEMLVMPADADALSHIQQLSIGAEIQVNAHGHIRNRSRRL